MIKHDLSKLVIATNNTGKLKEIYSLFAPFGLDCVSAGDLGIEEPEETETTFVGNARIKAHASAKAANLPALADDSGICVDGLNGDPGVYTADWAETPNGRDFFLAMSKVHAGLLSNTTPEPWLASFMCVLCLAFPNGDDVIFEGRVDGTLTWPIQGENGFGFDPMFIPNGQDKTFGEMSFAEKEPLTHRAAAFLKLVTYLEDR